MILDACRKIGLFLFCAALIVGIGTPVSADESSPDIAAQIAAQFPLVIDEPRSWEPDDLLSLWHGANALPPGVWEHIEEPITIEGIGRPCMSSMGRYSVRCPTFGDAGGYHFYIYDTPPLIGEGPVESLRVLTRTEQRDVQLRRAIVHLAMVHVDRQLEWSQRWEWQSINGWQTGDTTALNRSPRGYSRYLGMDSARLDLVTFAEEFFVRPEDLLLEGADRDPSIAGRLAKLHVDDTLPCRQFTKRRVMLEFLRELDDQWSTPERSGFAGHQEEARCPAFQQWARPDLLEGFDVLLHEGTGEQVESIFGYLLLHARYAEQSTSGDDSLDRLFRFDMVVDDDIDVFTYAMRRTLGGLTAELSVSEVGTESMNLRRYELQLTEEQKLRLLQRLWEADQALLYPYFFIRRNYSSLLLDLIEPVLDSPLSSRRRSSVTTPDVLQTLARQSNGDHNTLLKMRSYTADDDEPTISRLIGPPGRHRVHLGTSWAPERWAPNRGHATVHGSYSYIYDRLGEPRRRGFLGERGIRILGLDTTVLLDEDALRNIQADLTVLDYANLQRWRRDKTHRLGWGISARLSHDGRRDLWGAAAVDASLMMPVWRGSEYAHHLVIHSGATVRNDIYRGASIPLAGAVGGLFGQVHLYGSYVNILRFGARTSQYISAAGPAWEFDVRGHASSRHALLYLREHPLVLSPYVEMLWTTRDYREDAPPDGFQTWETGARMELPF